MSVRPGTDTMISHKKVAVVGAGYAGLAAVKNLLDENIIPVCYEKTSKPGGTWCFRKDISYGVCSTMSTTTINSSKETLVLSTQMIPDDVSNFMKHDEFYKQLMDYFQDSLQFVRYDTEVVSVKRTSDYDQTGRWIVAVRDTKTQEVTSEEFHGVLICAGNYGCPYTPKLPGIEKFEGKVLHTHDLRTFESFHDKNIVVIGFGCSAMDAATELSRVANQVYLSARSQAWIIPRALKHGYAFDAFIMRRLFNLALNLSSTRFASSIFHNLLINPKFNHELYGISPKSPVLSREPTISDDIFPKLSCGAVILRKNIKSFQKDSVLFEEEHEATKADVIVFATGYKDDFSYVEDGVFIREENGKVNLYKLMYPYHLKHPTLAFIDYFLPWGPGFPLTELQVRWAVYLLSGKGSLPPKDVMMDDICKRYEDNAARFPPSRKLHIRVDFVSYADDLASQFGVKPNFFKMAFSDPKLFLRCVLSNCSSYQYRLEGPHKWDSARDAIMSSKKRIIKGFSGGEQVLQFDSRSEKFVFVVMLFVPLLVLFFL